MEIHSSDAVWDLDPSSSTSSSSLFSQSAPSGTSSLAQHFEQQRGLPSSCSSSTRLPPSEDVCEFCGCSTVPLWRVSPQGLITCSGCGRPPRAPYDSITRPKSTGPMLSKSPSLKKRCKNVEAEKGGGFSSGVSLGSSSKVKRRDCKSSSSSMEPPSSTSRPSSSGSNYGSLRGSHSSSSTNCTSSNSQRVHFTVPEESRDYIDLTSSPAPSQHASNSNSHPPNFPSNIPPELLLLAFPDNPWRANSALQTAALHRRSVDQSPSSSSSGSGWQQSMGGAFSSPSPGSVGSRGGGDLLSWMRDLASPAASTPSSGSSGSASTPGSVSSSSTFAPQTPAGIGPPSTLDLLTSLLNSGSFPQLNSSLGSTSTPNQNPFPPRSSHQPLPGPSPPRPSFPPLSEAETVMAFFASLQDLAPPQPPPPPLPSPNYNQQQPPPRPQSAQSSNSNGSSNNQSFALPRPLQHPRPQQQQQQLPPPSLPPPSRLQTSSISSSQRSQDPEVQAELVRLRNRVAELEFLNRIVQLRNVELETEKAAAFARSTPTPGWSLLPQALHQQAAIGDPGGDRRGGETQRGENGWGWLDGVLEEDSGRS
ncbi:hypothetical protein BDY24DRAFT_413836 [Mrakia frigida]|uniref:uncharacterized protein n=1 Tax=Mrakia frigida TaxID=29902 RepID=UPI003FCC025E